MSHRGPTLPSHRRPQTFGPPPQLAIGCDERDSIGFVRNGVDQCVVTAPGGVDDRDAVGDPDGDALTSPAFENDHDRSDNSSGGDRLLHLVHEEPGRSCSVPPPTGRTRPDDVRGIDQKHAPILVGPPSTAVRLPVPDTSPRRRSGSGVSDTMEG